MLCCARNDGFVGTCVVLQLTFEIADTLFRSRGIFRPSFAAVAALESAEGAGKAGRRLAPAVRCAQMRRWKQMRSGIQGSLDIPAFPAQWLYGLCRALPGERCTIAPVVSRMADVRARSGSTHHRKTWRTGSGRQDHTILPYADGAGRVRAAFAHGVTRPANRLRADAACVHHVPSRVRDDRDPPLGRVGMGETCDNSEFA